MAVAVKLTLEDGAEVSAGYLVPIAGCTEERHFREAPEARYVEFEDGEPIRPGVNGEPDLFFFPRDQRHGIGGENSARASPR